MLDNFPRKPLLLLRRAFRGRLHPDLRPATAAASVQRGSAETSAAPSRAPVSFQKTSAPSWPRLCSKRQPEPRQVRGPDATRAAQRFFPLEGLRPYIILSAPLETASRPPWLVVSRVSRLRPWRSLQGGRGKRHILRGLAVGAWCFGLMTCVRPTVDQCN